jgi:hypothetical protein
MAAFRVIAVIINVGHACCRSNQRYADLLVGQPPASTGVLSLPNATKIDPISAGQGNDHPTLAVRSNLGYDT